MEPNGPVLAISVTICALLDLGADVDMLNVEGHWALCMEPCGDRRHTGRLQLWLRSAVWVSQSGYVASSSRLSGSRSGCMSNSCRNQSGGGRKHPFLAFHPKKSFSAVLCSSFNEEILSSLETLLRRCPPC